jgi:TonB family protein
MIYLVYLLAAIGATDNPSSSQDVASPPPLSRPDPRPRGNPGNWATSNDYPSVALQQEIEGTSGFSLTVGPDGLVSDCVITQSSGSPELDTATCTNVKQRARFEPALDASGTPTTGKYANRIRWQIPEVLSMASMPKVTESLPRPAKPSNRAQLTIPADKYPAAASDEGKQGQTTFMLNIDSTGKVLGCSVTVSSKVPELDQQACALAREWSFDPALDVNGEPSSGKSVHTLSWRLPKRAASVSMNPQRARPNPFEKPGSIGLTLEFDAAGKLTSCRTESEGTPFGEIGDKNFLDMACAGIENRDVAPFLDSEGKPQAKRIKFRVSVEHEDPKTGAVSR